MRIENIVRAITLILAPVVMVSSCAVFLNGLQSRYNSLSDRLRQMHRERLKILRKTNKPVDEALAAVTGIYAIRLNELDKQLPKLLYRFSMMRNAIVTLQIAIATFVLSMFVIAAATLTGFILIAIAAEFIFLLGTAILLTGVLITTREVYRSHREVRYEIYDGLRAGTHGSLNPEPER
ncbi:MAG: hypothetical protein OJF49_002690 [Ktedonobacterales bacterium]|jgi:hypothetical protein|nr:MAG: hypothetical protein OJF49_002690 [Ktedonobacterales bacterium]